MSGTSLDGLDIAYVEFIKKEKWHYHLGPCQTIKYTEEWLEKLYSLSEKSKSYISKIDQEFGVFIATCVNDFVKANQVDVDLICSHGHTVFHKPEINYTLQIGCGKNIAKKSKKMVVCDFRSLDVSLNGQGAPLVPLGDMLLFANYTYCLNLGGFSNVSYQKETERKAFDICPVNIVLNKLAQKLGVPFDEDGEIAKKGVLIKKLDATSTLINNSTDYKFEEKDFRLSMLEDQMASEKLSEGITGFSKAIEELEELLLERFSEIKNHKLISAN